MKKYLLLVFLFSLALFYFGFQIKSADAAYSYYRTITVTSTDTFASGTLNNFPMLINISSSSYLQDISTGGRVNNANGYDIIFSTSSDCSTSMSFEREKYSSSTGELIAWVNVPTSTAGTVTYLCYGDTAITTDQASSTATWNSTYTGVWHLKETATNTSAYVLDSTSNANNGSSTASGYYPTPTSTGQIDGAQSFDGNLDTVNSGSQSSLDDITRITISAWVYPRSIGNTNVIFDKFVNLSSQGWDLSFYGVSGPYRMRYQIYSDTNCFDVCTDIWESPNNSIQLNEWQYIAMTFDRSSILNNPVFYIDGQVVAVTQTLVQDGTGYLTDASYNLLIGGYNSGTAQLDGLLDEVRVSSSTLSSAWILSEYNNQNSPSTFYTIGSEISLIPAASSGSLEPVSPVPTLIFSASPSSISSGSSSTLLWVGTDTTSCTLNGTSQGTSGMQSTGILSASTLFNLVCVGTGGTAQMLVFINVTAPTPDITLFPSTSSPLFSPLSTTMPDLISLIQTLQTQLKSLILQAQSLGLTLSSDALFFLNSFPPSFTRNLTLDSQGEDVTSLQQFLVQRDTGPKARALRDHGLTSFFGLLTQSALAEYQTSVNISPHVGFFGPKTRRYMNRLRL